VLSSCWKHPLFSLKCQLSASHSAAVSAARVATLCPTRSPSARKVFNFDAQLENCLGARICLMKEKGWQSRKRLHSFATSLLFTVRRCRVSGFFNSHSWLLIGEFGGDEPRVAGVTSLLEEERPCFIHSVVTLKNPGEKLSLHLSTGDFQVLIQN